MGKLEKAKAPKAAKAANPEAGTATTVLPPTDANTALANVPENVAAGGNPDDPRTMTEEARAEMVGRLIAAPKLSVTSLLSSGAPAVPPVDGRALVVRSRSRKGFRRAGFAFTPEPRTIPAKFLSGTEHDAIVNDPNLIVEIVAVDDD